MSTHAAVQKRQHKESAPQNVGPGKSIQAAGVGLPLFMQTKLAIGANDDPLEQEADRVAEQVLAKPAHPDVNSAPPRIQRYTGQATGQAATAPASVDHVLAGPGRSLDPVLRHDMEQRFGHDFSRVRVHTGAAAEQSAQDVNATAYTVGHDMVFGAGEFAPASPAGRRLLAHELTHVTQQNAAGPDGGQSVRQLQRQPMDPRHARGHGGEQSMGFGYSQEKGWILIEGPSGAAGHGVTTKGFDGVAYNPKADELHVIDNKSLKAGTAYTATAITKNLGKNLDTLIAKVQGMKDMPDQARILQHLTQMRNAITTGNNIPANTKLIVTGESGQATKVGGSLIKQGVEFREPGTTGPSPPRTSAPTPPGKEEASNKPMRKPPGGGPRGTVTATAKTVTSHKASTPEVTTLKGPSNLGTPEYSATPDTPPASTKTQTPAKKAPAKPKVPVQTKTPAVPSTATPDVTPNPHIKTPPAKAVGTSGSSPDTGKPPPADSGKLPKGSVFEQSGSPLPKSVIETTGQPPLPKDSVFNIKTPDAPAASSATTTGATTTSMKKGRVTVDFDPNAPGYKNMVKRVRIYVSDLPPLPKTGGAGGMGPKMVNMVSIGETMLGLYGEAAGGETQKNIEKIIDPIKSHFRGKLEDARVEFHSNYRAVSFLKQAAGLEDLRTAYEAAMKRTKILEAQRAWLGLAIAVSVDNPKVSQEDLQRMVESYNSGQWVPTGAQLDKLEGARQSYEDAAYLVQAQIQQYDQKLMKAHAENIAKRAGILLDAGQSLSDTFWGLMQTVGHIPLVYYELWPIYDKATLFMELGAGMSAFAGEIRGRALEYEQAIKALDQTLIDVGATRFKGLYREPRK